MKKSKNKERLDSLIKYCEEHPELRFWQALSAWSKNPFIYISDLPIDQIDLPPRADCYFKDTFYIDSGKPKNNFYLV